MINWYLSHSKPTERKREKTGYVDVNATVAILNNYKTK